MKIKTSLLTLTAMTGLMLPLTAQTTPETDVVPSAETPQAPRC